MLLHQFYRSYCSYINPKVCIVGSGPAGFYVAQHLLKMLPNVQVDMFEKLPVPYGLVRYGVAPDHPEVKNVISTFAKTASHKNFNFLGNVSLGKDIAFEDLQQAYHGVVLSYGCSEEKKLGIKGEESILSARRIVGWYNGLPDDKDLSFDLTKESCIIIGQGNVAIDVARILLSPVDELKKTDITSYSLDALSKSKVKKVHLIGRRGPLHVAFTIKEFREMTKIRNVGTFFEPSALDGLDEYLPSLQRPRKRLTELLIKTASTPQIGEKQFRPLFHRKPQSYSNGVFKFIKTAVKDNLKGIVVDTDHIDEIECGLAIASVGYKGVLPDPALPFDEASGVVITSPGVYGSGWIKTGPTGVIIFTMNNAFQEAGNIISDIESGKLPIKEPKPGIEYIKTILSRKGKVTVSFHGWKKIDQVEVERGAKLGKPREKIVDVEEMLKIGGG